MIDNSDYLNLVLVSVWFIVLFYVSYFNFVYALTLVNMYLLLFLFSTSLVQQIFSYFFYLSLFLCYILFVHGIVAVARSLSVRDGECDGCDQGPTRPPRGRKRPKQRPHLAVSSSFKAPIHLASLKSPQKVHNATLPVTQTTTIWNLGNKQNNRLSQTPTLDQEVKLCLTPQVSSITTFTHLSQI